MTKLKEIEQDLKEFVGEKFNPRHGAGGRFASAGGGGGVSYPPAFGKPPTLSPKAQDATLSHALSTKHSGPILKGLSNADASRVQRETLPKLGYRETGAGRAGGFVHRQWSHPSGHSVSVQRPERQTTAHNWSVVGRTWQ